MVVACCWVWCGVVWWLGVVWCGVVWCGVVACCCDVMRHHCEYMQDENGASGAVLL